VSRFIYCYAEYRGAIINVKPFFLPLAIASKDGGYQKGLPYLPHPVSKVLSILPANISRVCKLGPFVSYEESKAL